MNSQYAMVLYPKQAFLEKEPAVSQMQIVGKLSNVGFLGDFFCVDNESQEEQTGYFIGDHFLQLITFLGCSPHLAVTLPEQGSDWHHFCHIEIQEFSTAQFFKGLNRPKCSCSQCKSRLNLSLSELEQWVPGSMTVRCTKCQHSERPEELNWRHSAGFSSIFIIIHSVYPSEAVPTEQLMAVLNDDSAHQWDYFYYEA